MPGTNEYRYYWAISTEVERCLNSGMQRADGEKELDFPTYGVKYVLLKYKMEDLHPPRSTEDNAQL